MSSGILFYGGSPFPGPSLSKLSFQSPQDLLQQHKVACAETRIWRENTGLSIWLDLSRKLVWSSPETHIWKFNWAAGRKVKLKHDNGGQTILQFVVWRCSVRKMLFLFFSFERKLNKHTAQKKTASWWNSKQQKSAFNSSIRRIKWHQTV